MKRVKYEDGIMYVNLNPTGKEEAPVSEKKSMKRYLITVELVLLAFTLGYLAGSRDVIENSHFIR